MHITGLMQNRFTLDYSPVSLIRKTCFANQVKVNVIQLAQEVIVGMEHNVF